jgi:thiosulfate dehydrogenase
MRFLESSWCPICLGLITVIMILAGLFSNSPPKVSGWSYERPYYENEEWVAPSEDQIPGDAYGDLVRYGKELIVHTSNYLGPRGIVAARSNGMNCQNCHINAGRQSFANPFSAVNSTYPKYRDRSGKVESIQFRVNECMQRSLNGESLDSTSLEMEAMVAYLKWVGKAVGKDLKPVGASTEELPLLARAASPAKGRQVYTIKCQRCHGSEGEGLFTSDSSAYTYPPLWGANSFNVSAGLYRLSRLAGFIKNSMPFGVTKTNPELTNEEAWDVAAYIASQPRPQKVFVYDWPDIKKKPVDFPFGPFADNFSEQQHKYGPFGPMKKKASK